MDLGHREQLALRVLQLGAIAVVLAVSPRHQFDLDRFLIPKELALHATALVAGLLAWRAMRLIQMTRVDKLLLAYLAVSAVSALLATNRWLGLRAFALSASAVLIFYVARGLQGRAVLNGLAFAVVLVAVTSLLQAYGLRTDFFALNRAPGGTLGNRNFVAMRRRSGCRSASLRRCARGGSSSRREAWRSSSRRWY